MFNKIYFALNLNAGLGFPIKETINDMFKDFAIKWEIVILEKKGDMEELVKRIIPGEELLVVYGGDGTLTEAARSIMDKNIPLAILPGGTANVMAKELNIPQHVPYALELIKNGSYSLKDADMGVMNDIPFALRISIGAFADIVKTVDPNIKANFGQTAYTLSAITSFLNATFSKYIISIDGKVKEVEGVSLLITNAGNIGIPGFSIMPNINVFDGLLDIILIKNTDILGMIDIASSSILNTDISSSHERWRGKNIKVKVDPVQTIVRDDEVITSMGELEIKVIPNTIKFLVPKQ